MTRPTDRRYWLVAAEHPTHGERKYFISNAPADASLAVSFTKHRDAASGAEVERRSAWAR